MRAPAPTVAPSRLLAGALALLLAGCGSSSSSSPAYLVALDSLAVESSPVSTGQGANAAVTLTSPGSGAVAVALAVVSGPATVPQSVVVAASSRSATFRVTAGAGVLVPTPVTISATYKGVTKTATLTVVPACSGALSQAVGGPGSFTEVDPAAWSGACAVHLHAAALGAGERLALLAINAGGPDLATPSVALAAGTLLAAPAAEPLAAALPAASPDAAPPLAGAAPGGLASTWTMLGAGHDLTVARRQEAVARLLAEGLGRGEGAPAGLRAVAAPACLPPPAVGSGRTFCVDKLGSVRATEQRPATLRHVSAHALYYVTDDVWPAFPAALGARYGSLWTDLDDYFEGTSVGSRNPGGSRRIYPSLQGSFGAETDVDGNCRVIFLMANLTKYNPPGAQDYVAGFFDPNDMSPADPGCGGSGSNHADMLYLLDPATWVGLAGGLNPAATVLDEALPGVMAHELQHNVLFNSRCWPSFSEAACYGATDPAVDLWMNEGLSMVSEDLAGFGMNTVSGRTRYVGAYLKVAPGFSLTAWPANGAGDAVGHYGGAHAFMRWLLDQAGGGCLPGPGTGCPLTRTLAASTLPSGAAIAAATGTPFEEQFLHFSAGALLSGETFNPAPAYGFAAVVPWSPLHTTVGWSVYTPIPASAVAPSLRHDGWRAYLSGPGTGGDVTLSVSSSAGVKPRLGVARFSGTLVQP